MEENIIFLYLHIFNLKHIEHGDHFIGIDLSSMISTLSEQISYLLHSLLRFISTLLIPISPDLRTSKWKDAAEGLAQDLAP